MEYARCYQPHNWKSSLALLFEKNINSDLNIFRTYILTHQQLKSRERKLNAK